MEAIASLMFCSVSYLNGAHRQILQVFEFLQVIGTTSHYGLPIIEDCWTKVRALLRVTIKRIGSYCGSARRSRGLQSREAVSSSDGLEIDFSCITEDRGRNHAQKSVSKPLIVFLAVSTNPKPGTPLLMPHTSLPRAFTLASNRLIGLASLWAHSPR